jgi:glycosyltransferase involved in cell wall biosynthesis
VVCGPSAPAAELAVHPSVSILSLPDPARLVEALQREIREFSPDWVLVSSEDMGHGLLRLAHHAAPGRVVYLAHTPQFFPFGPASWNPNPHAAELLRQAAGIVAIGRHMGDYIERELDRPVAVIHPPIYGPGPFPNLANFERGAVAMFNPCAVKGIDIFLRLAERLPAVEFAAVPGWGTTSEDRAALARLPNVRLLPNARSIDDLLARTRVLLMPSLWHEGFGLTVMEAMLRGVPAVASSAGGLPEAKRGTGYVIPVRPIEHYRTEFDEQAMPRPVLPENPIEPWVETIQMLLANRSVYEQESAASRAAALPFVQGLDAGEFERYLAGLQPRGLAGHAARATVESLSPEKRALLLERLRRRRGSNPES